MANSVTGNTFTLDDSSKVLSWKYRLSFQNVQVSCVVSGMTPEFSVTKTLSIAMTTPLVITAIEDMTVMAGETIVFRPTVTSVHNYEELEY